MGTSKGYRAGQIQHGTAALTARFDARLSRQFRRTSRSVTLGPNRDFWSQVFCHVAMLDPGTEIEHRFDAADVMPGVWHTVWTNHIYPVVAFPHRPAKLASPPDEATTSSSWCLQPRSKSAVRRGHRTSWSTAVVVCDAAELASNTL